MPAMYVLTAGIAGVKTKHSFVQRLKVLVISEMIVNSFVQTFKKSIKRRRPDSLFKYNSFPSGHTATSFAGAVIMHKEIDGYSYLPGFSGYIIAITTATMRLYKRKHWLSDIISGAIIGIASAAVAYRFIKNR
jgi:membrane-associated phospholipid phosphatase